MILYIFDAYIYNFLTHLVCQKTILIFRYSTLENFVWFKSDQWLVAYYYGTWRTQMLFSDTPGVSEKHSYRPLFYTGRFCKNEGWLVPYRYGDWRVFVRFDAINPISLLLSVTSTHNTHNTHNTQLEVIRTHVFFMQRHSTRSHYLYQKIRLYKENEVPWLLSLWEHPWRV
jgi:hypothetical protein